MDVVMDVVIAVPVAMERFLLVLILCYCLPAQPGDGYSAAQGPAFLREPPALVQFLNSTGAIVDCTASGQPTPRISWVDTAGHDVLHVPGLREVLDNGSLYFPPFPAQVFRSNLHANTYRCKATNAVGTVISRDCNVRGETMHAWSTQVHRVQSLVGNVAVLRCNIPAAARQLVRVVGWQRDLRGNLAAIHMGTSGRYTATSQGTLHVRDVDEDDAADTYYCQTQHVVSGDVRVSSGAQIIVKAAEADSAPHIDSTPSTVHARAGSATELACAAQGHPPPTYRWFRELGGSLLELDPGQLRARPIESVLELPRAQPEDSGRYTCVVSNRVKEVRRHLQLLVSQPLSAHLRPQHQMVDAGRTAVFNCSVRGGQPSGPASSASSPTATFIKDGEPLVQGGRISVHVTQSGVDLVVRRVVPADRGMYQCVAVAGEETAQASAELTLGAIAPELLDGFREQTLQPGPPMSLHCAVSGQPPPRVTWLLDGAELAGPAGLAAYQLGSFVSPRGHVVSHLNVSSARTVHGGLYTCVARNLLGTALHSAPVNIYGPPTPRPPLNLTAVADTDLFLRCPVAGYPVTSVTWSRGEARADARAARLPDSMRQRVFPNGTLLIKGVQGAADKGQYACTVTNQQGQLATGQLHLNVMKPPIIVPFSFHSGLEDGNRLQVSCSIMSGDLPITIEWRKDGRPLSSLPLDTSVAEQQHQFASNLLFSDLSARHSGTYTCVASNAAASANFSAPLVVRVRPRWLVEPQDVEVLYQESAAIHCRASGFPEPSITWMKAPETSLGSSGSPSSSSSGSSASGAEESSGDYAVLSSDPLLSVAENGSVLLVSAQPSHVGRYMCQARNGIGPGISKVVHLRVNVPAHFHTRSVNVSGAAGQAVVLDCVASGDPPLSISWRTPSGEEPPSSRILETATANSPGHAALAAGHGLTSQLHLMAERHHAGLYRCTASNKYGSDTMAVHLAVQEAPGAPVGLEVMEAGSRWLSLGWSLEGMSGSSATHYVIQFHRESGPSPSSSLSALDPALVWYNMTVSGSGRSVQGRRSSKLTGLDPATTYWVRVLAANEVGVGPPSEAVTAQTLQEAPTLPPAEVTAEALAPESLTIRWKPPALHSSPGALLGYQVRYRAVSVPGQPSLSALPALTMAMQGMFTPPSLTALPALAAPAGEEAGDAAVPWLSRTVRGGLRQEVVLHGLESYTRYEVTVRAFNEVGAGPASSAITATTKEGVPTEPPGSVRCTALTSQNVRVRWEPPPKAGRRGALDGYKVFYRRRLPAGLPAVDLPSWMTASPEMEVKKTMNLETNLFGLAKFSNYTVQVAALTSAGEGVRSEPVHCSTEEDVPGPPEQVKALAMSSDSILVTWTRPLETNGNIAKYLVYMRPSQPQAQGQGMKEVRKETVYAGGAGSVGGPGADRSSELALEVRRLKELERLDFWVTAATSVGEGPPSARVNQAPVSRVPARVASFSRTAAAGEGQMLTLACRAVGVPAPARTWRGPRGLALSVSGSSQAAGQSLDQAESASRGAVLIGDGALRLGPLSQQDVGNYSCHAENVFGKDEILYRVVVVGPPAAPVIALAVATDRSLQIKWTSPTTATSAPTTSYEGAPITGYVLQYKREMGEWQEREVEGDPGVYTLPGLRCGSPYLLTLAAVNGVGRGARSNVLQAATLGAPPKVPLAEEVLSVNSTTATLFLDAWPVAGCPVTYFVVDFRTREAGQRPGPWTLVANRAGPQQTVTVAGLSAASWYELRVAAHSDAGSTRHQFVFATRTKKGDAVPLELMPALAEGPGPLSLPTPVSLLVAVVSGITCTAAVATCAIIAFRKRQYAGYRRGDAKTLDELENQRNHEHHQVTGLTGLAGLTGLSGLADGDAHHQLYSPSPVRKTGISSSLTGQKGSDTSDYEICPYATFSLANAGQGAGTGVGSGAGSGAITPSKSLASYSLQLHTFSQRDCYAEGPARGPPASRRHGGHGQHYSRTRSSKGASSATPRANPTDSGEGVRDARPRKPSITATASPPDGLSLEISCISSQQTLPMSMAVHQRRKASSPTHSRGSVGASRPRSLAMASTPGPGAGPGGHYESDSSSPGGDKHGHQYGYRQHAHTPSRRSSKGRDLHDSSADSTDMSPEVSHRADRTQGPTCRSLPRRGCSPRSRPRQPHHKPLNGDLEIRARSDLALAAVCAAYDDFSDAQDADELASTARLACRGPGRAGHVGLNGDLDSADYGCVGGGGTSGASGASSDELHRSQLLYPDAQLEQELSSLIKRYRHERQREKQDYTIHV